MNRSPVIPNNILSMINLKFWMSGALIMPVFSAFEGIDILKLDFKLHIFKINFFQISYKTSCLMGLTRRSNTGTL